MSKNTKEEINIERIKCVWGLFCNLSSTDKDSNNISLFNVVEQFNIPKDFFIKQKEQKKPLLFVYQSEIVSCWRRTLDIGISNEEISFDLKIKTIDPSGEVLQEVLTPFKLQKGIKRLRSRVLMQGILASIPGDYVHQLEIKLLTDNSFKKVHEIPFEVRESVTK